VTGVAVRNEGVPKPTGVSRPHHLELLPIDLEGFDVLADLALDIHASWNHSADDIWRQLDPILWDLTNNPWGVLQTQSRDRLERLLTDPVFRSRLDALAEAKARDAASPAWFAQSHASSLSCVAYFSMEFMLSEALPIYSGGLGNVAGDQLKAASDLGVPVVGVGLLYQQGYFRQTIDQSGAQQALFPYNDPGQLPITPLRRANGEWLRFELGLPGHSIWLRAWQVQVGRTRLYLLDSNDLANLPEARSITSELYGGGPELRLKQELVLGIGGWRLLCEMGLQPEVCHLNEGHAAFAVLERARAFMRGTGQNFELALAATRPGNLFTTHTAVAAGFDRFEPELIERYLGRYLREQLGVRTADLLALGRQDPDDAAESFNMAYLAIRASGRINAVSQLHGKVSRRLFAPLFPNWPFDEIPVGAVTNGVHVPTWDSSAADAVWTEVCGKNRWRAEREDLERSLRCVGDEQLWKLRNDARRVLVSDARERLALQLKAAGAPAQDVSQAQSLFDENTLTLAFARRFATYKRPNLLLHDPERLQRLLTNPQRPVQLIIAGKAHPADRAGQDLIQTWIRFIRRPELRQRVIFLSDYDMLMTERLVQGADLWLNTPRRPWEACGTSGMKVLVNGGLNLSVLDGWWAEAYGPEVGWALGDELEHSDEAASDARDAEQLYRLLEDEVVPMFYARNERGLPRAWLSRIRESMARLTPHFSASRAVREYTTQHYVPAALAYRARASDGAAEAARVVAWRSALQQAWDGVRVVSSAATSTPGQHEFVVRVQLGAVDPAAVSVELFANGMATGGQVVPCKLESAGPDGCIYRAITPDHRLASDYTARVVPSYAGAAVPLEAPFIRWRA
jgi:glycogen phosphorylase